MTQSVLIQLAGASLTAFVLLVMLAVTFSWWIQTVRDLLNPPKRVSVEIPVERRSRRRR